MSGRRHGEGRGAAIGKVVAARRAERGWSVNRLAQYVGVSHTSIRDLENGETKTPGLEFVLAVSHALGMALEDLLMAAGIDVGRSTMDTMAKTFGKLGPHEREVLLSTAIALKRLQEAYAGYAGRDEVEEDWDATAVEPVAADSGDYRPHRLRVAEPETDYDETPQG